VKTAEHKRKVHRAWREKNRAHVLARDKRWAAANPDKVAAHRLQFKNHMLKKLYGITLAQMQTMFEAQGKRCALCFTDSFGYREPQVDHDHKTGRVRGIVCRRCNAMLIQIEHGRVNVDRIVEYLALPAPVAQAA
jgi:Recombination endonuclease VII